MGVVNIIGKEMVRYIVGVINIMGKELVRYIGEG